MMLVIGVPKEIKFLEKRVGLTPYGVKSLKASGFDVLIQKDAGTDSGFLDLDYQRAGAKICPSIHSLYESAELIVKVKEPQPTEYSLLSSKHTLFCFLHLASQEACACVKALIDSGATAIGYETLEIDGLLPLLKPMSEIAGGLSFSYGQFLWEMKKSLPQEGNALTRSLFKIAMEYPKLPQEPKEAFSVIVWGGGVAGESAVKMALQAKQKTKVTLIEPRESRRKELMAQYSDKMDFKCIAPECITEDILAVSDLWIGCVHRKGERAMQVISLEAMRKASQQKQKVIMDISIDQGGNFPESRTTFYDDPIFFDSLGNLRFCVANVPSFCGRYASESLEKAALPFVEFLAANVEYALEKNESLKSAVNIKNHQVMIEEIRRAHQI